MTRRTPAVVVLFLLALSASSCDQLQERRVKQEDDPDLRITLGGFREGHPDEGSLDGVCTPDVSRTVMSCDIYNGIVGWAITEISLAVTWSPYNEGDKRYYSERVSINPQKTQSVTIRLGLQLPLDTQLRNKRGAPIGPPSKHWGWNLVGAKGHQLH